MANENTAESVDKSASELMQEGLAELAAPIEDEVTEEVESTEPSAAEVKARSMGWNPDFDGDEFIGAEEFIRRQPLFDKINHETKARKKVEEQVKALTQYVKKLTEGEYNRQLATLRAQRELALEEQDTTKADQINDQIVDLKANQKVAEAEEETAASSNAEEVKAQNQAKIGQWINRNPWYNQAQNPDLFEMADDYAEQFALKNPDKTLDELLVFVDSKMKRHIPQADDNDEEEYEIVEQKKEKPMSKVASAKGTTRRPAAKAKYTKADLNTTQRQIMDSFVNQGVMTEQEYIDSLVAMGEVTKNNNRE